VLLLGGLVLLAVCSGINERFDATSQSDAGGASGSEWQQQWYSQGTFHRIAWWRAAATHCKPPEVRIR
jgi:hypothetical protein